jgi:uncharacterized protein YbjT (DUF2867 family)
MNEIILVVGATGMLGEPVARQLHEDGYRVRLLARNPDKAKRLFGDVYEIVPGDVEKPATLEAPLTGCFGVHINLAGGPSRESYDRVEFQGTANVARVASRVGVKRLTYLSGASIREDRTWFYYAQAKFQAETAVRACGIAHTIFRASWFMESLPLFVMGKRAFLIGKQRAPLHWVAAGDYARIVSKSYRTAQAENKTLYIYGPETFAMNEALRLYCSIVRPGMAVWNSPVWLVSLLAKLSGDAKLQDGARLMGYFQGVTEDCDPTETNRILGPPTTTLRQWCEEQRLRFQKAGGEPAGNKS